MEKDGHYLGSQHPIDGFEFTTQSNTPSSNSLAHTTPVPHPLQGLEDSDFAEILQRYSSNPHHAPLAQSAAGVNLPASAVLTTHAEQPTSYDLYANTRPSSFEQYLQERIQRQRLRHSHTQIPASVAVSSYPFSTSTPIQTSTGSAQPLGTDLGEVEGTPLLQDSDTAVFESHRCDTIPIGGPHPGSISESSLLACVNLPRLTYPLDTFHMMAEKGQLSQLQLEGILYAAQRHQLILPSGERAGFFIGDGAGVGKGRQIAGIIMDGVSRGRPRHVWVSMTGDLRYAAERDLTAIGCHIKVIDGLIAIDTAGSKALGMSDEFKRGCLFTTYSTMISSPRGRKSRLDQIAAWCGPDFQGALVFDEAHKAKNFNVANEDASTKVSRAVIELQKRLPNARVVYCSATGVTDISNMAYATRLGLWGPSTPFNSFSAFVEAMNTRGLGSLELLASELKASGSYVARGLSWQGAEFETITVPLSPEDEARYDAAVHLWLSLRSELERAVSLTGASSSRMRLYWSAAQRFFKELAIACKVPCVVERCHRAIDSGHAVVIGLQSTGEAGLERAMEAASRSPGDPVPRLVSSAKCALIHFISEHFPVYTEPKSITVPTEEAMMESVSTLLTSTQTSAPSMDHVLQVVRDHRAMLLQRAATAAERHEVPELTAIRTQLLATARSLDMPPSPLDALVCQLGGPDKVAEMTGRRARIIPFQSGFRYELRTETDAESINTVEQKHFMAGRKRIAIISDAASTGISLHADNTAPSAGLRRVHITLELPWSADKAIQQLGRSHRTNQASAPIYELTVAYLGGEARFASAVAKRLASLGAITRGDRRAASVADMSAFNVDSKCGRQALKKMLMTITTTHTVLDGVDPASLHEEIVSAGTAKVSGDPGALRNSLITLAREAVSQLGMETKHFSNVRVFLNRIQMLSVRLQNLLFAYFAAALSSTVAEAKLSGTYEDSVADIKGQVTILKESEHASGTKLYHLKVDRGVSWQSVVELRNSHLESEEGGEAQFYISRNLDIRTKQPLILLACTTAAAPHRCSVTRPNTGRSQKVHDLSELQLRYTACEPDVAETLWVARHSSSQRKGVGERLVNFAVAIGVLPLWDTLEGVLTARRAELPATECSIKVCRCVVDSGKRFVGVHVPELCVPDVVELLTRPKNPFQKLTECEAPSPFSKKLFNTAQKAAPTLKHFFQRAASSEEIADLSLPGSDSSTQLIDLTSDTWGSHSVQESVIESKLGASDKLPKLTKSKPTPSAQPKRKRSSSAVPQLAKRKTLSEMWKRDPP